ncbi:hypothetical protein [Gracilibacillus dipsosauri]|uniref:Uncharacterized protein n=1 Tax=Gracilibacillus dipsosauri TaxID=178340 RepID=A0A317L270_9BACI|nr:hypothetical protein [Gracilibacillus dipsosauri]PWU69971.1 hypothetical protein DLJ74_03340 [Gracilibacillus dipsosauri]
MIKSKSMFYISLVFLFVAILLNFPFPHSYPFGEVILIAWNIPIRFADGLITVGIVVIFLLIIGLFLLVSSLKKYRGRIGFLVFILIIFTPGFMVNAYQENFATGIYAVSYAAEESECRFEMKSGETVHGECELSFINYSNHDVPFTVEFNEYDDPPMVSLMNNNAPYKITLGANETKRIRLETDIDVSDIQNHVESGEAMGMDIIIRSKGKHRDIGI